MATLRISYFATIAGNVPADPIGTEAVTTSGTSAASAAIPGNAVVAKIQGNAAHVFTIGTGTPTAADGQAGGGTYLDAGEVYWQRIQSSNRAALKFAAITV